MENLGIRVREIVLIRGLEQMHKPGKVDGA